LNFYCVIELAALGYGITKTDLPDASADSNVKPRRVCFVDMGHSSYQVAIVEFVKGKLVVKGAACDRNLGGRDFDEVLVDHYIQEFKNKYKIDIETNAKAKFRLRGGCEKAKKVLSANAFTMLNIECIMNDKDVSARIDRSDLESLAAPLFDRLRGPLENALKASGFTIDDIDFVELLGGSTRIPAVKETLAKFFGGSLNGENKLSTTLNQDEAVSRGCALQCAVISPVFKVRDFGIQDWNAYPIHLSWDPKLVPSKESVDAASSTTGQLEFFGLGEAVPKVKSLTFYRALRDEELNANNGSLSFTIDAAYMDGGVGLPPAAGKIGSWTITGIKKPDTPQLDPSKAKFVVKARLSGNMILG